jgi:hypothetical protein
MKNQTEGGGEEPVRGMDVASESGSAAETAAKPINARPRQVQNP